MYSTTGSVYIYVIEEGVERSWFQLSPVVIFLFFMMLEEHGACNTHGKMFSTKETFLIIMKTPALARYWWFPNF